MKAETQRMENEILVIDPCACVRKTTDVGKQKWGMYVNLGMRKLGHVRVREEPRVEARRQGISTHDCGMFEVARNQSLRGEPDSPCTVARLPCPFPASSGTLPLKVRPENEQRGTLGTHEAFAGSRGGGTKVTQAGVRRRRWVACAHGCTLLVLMLKSVVKESWGRP
jgi:hypothetical protein